MRYLMITHDVGHLSVIMTIRGSSLLNFADNQSLSNCKLVNTRIYVWVTIKKNKTNDDVRNLVNIFVSGVLGNRVGPYTLETNACYTRGAPVRIN